jgi:guanine nucleotide-binding protein subunit alpha
MGCCSGAQDDVDEQKKRSQAIDRTLEEDSKRLRRECKVLLLGADNSGKSTIVKQMKIIHQRGYTTEELALYRHIIYKNVLECARAIVQAMRHFEIGVENRENEEFCDYIRGYALDPDPHIRLEHTLGDAITAVWNDPCIPRLFDHENEFYLMDSAGYFFDEVKRITTPDYLPTEADVLRSRVKTTGISETRFSMGQLRVHLFDVGGQRSERKKWIHCFEKVTSVIYVVALSEYDQVLLEESSQNRMMEALILFDSIVNSRWFTRTSIILFLNKIDVLRNKLSRSPLQNYFPDYSGGNDVNRAAKYLLWRFNQVNRAHLDLYPQYVDTVTNNVNMGTDLFSSLTQATDTSNIRLVFAAVKETILKNAFKDTWLQL